MRFEFATATRILFGENTLREVAPLTEAWGRRALVVTGKNPQRSGELLEQLKKHSVETSLFSVPGEPTTDLVEQGCALAQRTQSELVIGIGGGSVLDTGKAIAALLTNGGALMDYLEVIGEGKPLSQPSAPYIALPTTAGTGAEVTRNAVLESPRHRVKVSMRSLYMLPRVAVVDPLLTHSMPPAVTASTGLDALTQLMEAFVSQQANPLTDGICREGIHRAARSLRRAYENGSDAAAREDMALASLLGGLALANAKLGAVHGFAGPLGGMFAAPHGVVCARLLPEAMMTNVHALRTRQPQHPALLRYEEVARILTGHSSADISEGVAWVRELCAALKVPSIGQYGVREEHFSMLIPMAQNSSSMKGNPIQLTEDELLGILASATVSLEV